jgi:hypothetical protein
MAIKSSINSWTQPINSPCICFLLCVRPLMGLTSVSGLYLVYYKIYSVLINYLVNSSYNGNWFPSCFKCDFWRNHQTSD